MTPKYRLSLLAAAAITVGTAGLPAWAQDAATADKPDVKIDATVDLNKPAAAAAGQAPKLPDGVQAATKDDSEDIRDMLAAAVEASVSNNGFDNLVSRFVDADRNRMQVFMKQAKDETYAGLNGVVAQLRADFKAKYGQEFDMNEDLVFGQFPGMHLVQGEIVNPALLSNWPVPQTGAGSATDQKPSTTPPAATTTPPARENTLIGDAGENKPSDRNLDKGRNVAIVALPASHGAPELTLSLIHEMPDNWKIDVPDTVDGLKLLTNLSNHLQKFHQQKDQWPADVNEAYRMASHHVYMAIYDLPHDAKGGAKAGEQPKPEIKADVKIGDEPK